LQFVFNQYFKALLMIALSTIIFIAVNNLVSTLPEGLVISPQGARVVSTTSTTTSDTTGDGGGASIVNLLFQYGFSSEFYDHLNVYWYLMHPDIQFSVTTSGLRVTYSDTTGRDTIIYFAGLQNVSQYPTVSVRVGLVDSEHYNRRGLVLVDCNDLNKRIYVTVEVTATGSSGGVTYYDTYFTIEVYNNGVVATSRVFKSPTSRVSAINLTVTRISNGYSVTAYYYGADGSVIYTQSTTFTEDNAPGISFWELCYPGVVNLESTSTFTSLTLRATHPDATDTVVINIHELPPPFCGTCPECPECPCMEGEVYIPLRLMGQFVAFTSYILFIVTALKNIMPEL
jgi:hypothetical protein